MKKESPSPSNGKRKKESDDKPLAKRGKKESTPLTSTAAKKAKIKEEQEAEIYKWWEEQEQKGMAEDDTIKWTKLEHNGVLFPPDYVPHGVKMKYDGKPITLSPEAEEVASFYAALLETDHGKNPTFQKNFFNDWLKILKKDPQVSLNAAPMMSYKITYMPAYVESKNHIIWKVWFPSYLGKVWTRQGEEKATDQGRKARKS